MIPRSRRWFLTASAVSLLPAQEEATFSTNVKVVNVLANVLGRKGEIVRKLEKTDFSILENGRPQTVQYFSRESDLPLTIGLMVDTSMSQQRVLDAERTASFRFLDQVLRPEKDQVFVMQFDMAVQLKQALTASRKKLADALIFVDTPTRRQLEQQTGGGTLLFDALVEASNKITASRTGRKALIAMTDGVDVGSTATPQDAIEAAQRADTLIYSILFADPSSYGIFGSGGEGRKPLVRMAKETGGAFFEVSKKQSIEQIFAIIEEELRGQYSLGYVSDTPVRISEFRKIQVAVKGEGLSVQARDRYWARR